MAEVFGIASSALSVAAFAGQLAQSANLLYNFVKDINNAPKIIQTISEELRILTFILLEIQKSYSISSADLYLSLQHCEKRLDELVVFVKKLDPTQYAQKRQRLWKQFQVALNRSDLTQYLQDLERCKLMLVQACGNITRLAFLHHVIHVLFSRAGN
jgi:Fungal N-terminal domain of STAND proteins